MLSPLRYPGGKAKLYPYFVELVRINGLYDYTYCEPYAGGAGLALKLLAHGFVSNVEINDVDPAIASFWRSVLHHPDRFCERISRIELTVAEWHRQRATYAKGQASDEFELGFATYFLNRTSRSGIIEGSGPIGGYKQESSWTIDARFNRSAQVDQVMEIARFSQSISVTQSDALEFSDARMRREKTFTYFDPPYYVKGAKLYKNFYTHEDHVRISEFLKYHKDSRWILSYDHVDEIISLYPDFDPFIYQLQYSAGQTSHGQEVIYSGDRLRLPASAFLRRAA